ncbi:MAG: aldehyde dehydrogenase [Bdellovibrionota bacterium]
MGFESLNWIDGRSTPAVSGRWLDNLDPATGKKFGLTAASDQRDVENAVQAAHRAFPVWSRMPARERSRILRTWSALLEADREEFAQLECVDTGKPLTLARELDIPRSVQNLEFFADAATQSISESVGSEWSELHVVLRQPLGVVACISPWNLPLYLLTWKIAPALASGNCVVAKPSEVTPLTATRLAELSEKAGMPPGVFNLVHGLGGEVGPVLTQHPLVSAITFTGSTATGKSIALGVAPLFKKVSLEMGGKNAAVVFADADLDRAIPALVRGAFRNQGQICLCGSRVLIEKSIYGEVRDRLVAETRKLRIGDPLEGTTDQGAIVSREQFTKIMGYLNLAQAEGGRFLTGSTSPARVAGRCEGGNFVEPTWIEGLGPDCRVNREEIFGPVATLQSFEDEAEALALVNSSRYGLAASVWTRDLDRANRMAREIETGLVWINAWMLRDLRTPFGGVKDSGLGREGGLEAMRFFTEPKTVSYGLRE